MHFFVRTCKKLKEEEAARLFYQIVSAVAHCHDGGVVLRDLKLRKFVFNDKERTRVKLESLEDAYILAGTDDSLSDKHGCPAYVSLEILYTNGSYSGKAVWSLVVMLYNMLVGLYPFHDIEPSSLFRKIRRGQFNISETLSPKVKCLIRSILRREPTERLISQEILDHPWFSTDFNALSSGHGAKEMPYQLVPDVNIDEGTDPFFKGTLFTKRKKSIMGGIKESISTAPDIMGLLWVGGLLAIPSYLPPSGQISRLHPSYNLASTMPTHGTSVPPPPLVVL
ncbi:tribbles homolog 2-like [Bombina bombina]|uniref:tribbles homolog 2-like n=1 Tax=Bombina bombina TaxID=8345 RepID=UPI00235AE9CC|nr:tribbles homolog 2-like [Bombina bombina]